MIRGLFKLIVLAVVVLALGVIFLGWNLTGDRSIDANRTGEAVGTTGEAAADKGREVGAEIGERAGQAAETAQRALSDGSLTAKIKAKMALDDTVKALNLDVDTRGSIVTVKGVVRSEAERQRALSLARETAGVTQVVDQLQVK